MVMTTFKQQNRNLDWDLNPGLLLQSNRCSITILSRCKTVVCHNYHYHNGVYKPYIVVLFTSNGDFFF